MKAVAALSGLLVMLVLSLLGLAATGGVTSATAATATGQPSGSGSASGSGGAAGSAGAGDRAPAPSATARRAIPAAMLTLYERGATACPGLSWTVLAGIGTVESDNDRSQLPGVHSGANFAGAEGPMQFEPATFAVYAQPVPPGGVRPPSPYDPADAVYAAARMLCGNGGRDDRDLPAAVWAYNHSAAYVSEVLDLAAEYTGSPGEPAGRASPAPPGPAAPNPSRPAAAPGPAAPNPSRPAAAPGPARPGPTGSPGTGGGLYPPSVVAVLWALDQRGTPYVWGGETPGVGFDCSGLVQGAYRVAGVALPRVAQDQYDAGPHLPAGAPLRPGDLVFFGGGPAAVSHVGIYVATAGGQAWMVDAPHTGADVRIEPFPDRPRAAWGTDVYVGATRPAGL